MREILFRGKRTDNGEWICGNCVVQGDKCFIDINISQMFDSAFFENHSFKEVIPETVGQYTGLTDNNRKNKKKIFEGDIVKAYFKFNPTDFVIGKVIFEYGTFKIRVTGTKKNGEFSKYTDDNIKAYAIENNFINRGYLLEVIGNIHDNPELLKND